MTSDARKDEAMTSRFDLAIMTNAQIAEVIAGLEAERDEAIKAKEQIGNNVRIAAETHAKLREEYRKAVSDRAALREALRLYAKTEDEDGTCPACGKDVYKGVEPHRSTCVFVVQGIIERQSTVLKHGETT